MDEKSDDSTKDGVRTVPLYSWQEFHQKACSLKTKRGYVWRGQRKDWPLLSSFDRQVPKSTRQHQRARDRKLKEHLNNFKEAMNKSYPNVLPPNDDHIWALGQQYGLKTPLLDWTLSPYIAAYFALIEGIDQNDRNDCCRYVYALNKSIERLVLKKGNKDRFVTFIDELPHPNPRFTAQKGIFSKVLRGRDIQEGIEKFVKKKENELLLVKFKIPTKDREECLHNLHLMNINHTSLLLDLRDVVDRCNSES
jgi:hypothetical protein